MKDSIYVLAKNSIRVEKLHLCTWDVRNHDTYVEVGISIAFEPTLPETIEVDFVLPFVSSACRISSLHENLNDSDNYKFIFNEIPESVITVGGEKRNGSVVKTPGSTPGTSNTSLIANVSTEINPSLPLVRLKMDKPATKVQHLYARILIETNATTIAEVIRGIAKCSYFFDIKINEARNIPSDVLDYMRSNHLKIQKIATAYCLHCVPDNYEISFSDSAKLKNIRRLEKNAFQRYLPFLKEISGEYTITFNKQSDASGNYSFFTTFNKEVIGNKQLLVAVATNLLCNLLFAVSAFRVVRTYGVAWYREIPVEWWIAVGVIVIGVLICLPFKSWGRMAR